MHLRNLINLKSSFLLWNLNNYAQRISYDVKEMLTEKILVFGVQDITNCFQSNLAQRTLIGTAFQFVQM